MRILRQSSERINILTNATHSICTCLSCWREYLCYLAPQDILQRSTVLGVFPTDDLVFDISLSPRILFLQAFLFHPRRQSQKSGSDPTLTF
jgi:hypothetical protein